MNPSRVSAALRRAWAKLLNSPLLPSPSASDGVSCTNLCSSPPATAAYPHGDVTSYSIKSQNQRIGGKEEPAEVRRSNSLLSKIFTHFLHLSKFSCNLSLELHLLCHLLIQELLGGLSLFRSTHSSSLACLRSTCLRMPEILAGLIACHPPLFYRKKGDAFKASKDWVTWPIPPVGLLPCVLATCSTRLHCTQHHSSTSSEGPLLLKGVENHFIKEKKKKKNSKEWLKEGKKTWREV